MQQKQVNIFQKSFVAVKNKLGIKFILLIAGILACTMLVSAVANYHYENNLYTEYVEKKHMTLGYLVAEMSTEAILSYDYDTLKQYVENITSESDVVYAVIRANDGKYLTNTLDYSEKAIADIIDRTQDDRFENIVTALKSHPDVINLDFPVNYYDSDLGTITIGISRDNIASFSRRASMRQLIGYILIISILCSAIFIVFRLSTLRPLQKLMSGLQHVANGNFEYKVPTKRNDEIGQLTHSFNDMVNILRTTHDEKDSVLQQLKEANDMLQTDVQQRAHKLDLANQELQRIALLDALTKLPNRYLVIENIQDTIMASAAKDYSFGVIVMDLDRFKEINDTLGHNVGDGLLIEFGKRLNDTLRDEDCVARLGGDEFALVIQRVDIKRLEKVAEKIIDAITPEFTVQDRPLFITSSMGLAVFPEHGKDPESLLRCADIAMYEAKHNKQGYSIYNPDLETANVKHLDLLGGLRTAINDNELFLQYQPKVDLGTGRVSGVEALVRWNHKERGFIPPDEFIGLAENSGLINPLTNWVLNEAIRQGSLWRQQGYELSVSVNLSMFNLLETTLQTYVTTLLEKYRFPPDKLVLEITETAIMSQPDMVLEVLRQMKDTGILISVDDFGTGYSSLSHLRKMPVSEVKIDRSFVMNMAKEAEDQLIVNSIVNLGHNLGLRVVAEGVEDVDSVVMLSEYGCDLVQGFYYSRPISAKEIIWFCKQPAVSVGGSAQV